MTIQMPQQWQVMCQQCGPFILTTGHDPTDTSVFPLCCPRCGASGVQIEEIPCE